MVENARVPQMKTAWLARWIWHGSDEEKRLRELNIPSTIADIISARKNFDAIVDIAKDLYMRQMLSISERFYYADYTKGKKRREDFFSAAPIMTNYNSPLYREAMELSRKNGMYHPKTQVLWEKFRKYPFYVSVGNNPSLEIKLVRNITIIKTADNTEFLEWDEPLADGTSKRESHSINRFSSATK